MKSLISSIAGNFAIMPFVWTSSKTNAGSVCSHQNHDERKTSIWAAPISKTVANQISY